jgi:triosephosphate isomerase
MRRPLIAGNWKMHGSRSENSALVESILGGLNGREVAEVLVCPPVVYLWEVGRQLRDSQVLLGAQTVSTEPVGAFTGEVCAAMLKDVGCTYAIVGHSERRALYWETDSLVARKFLAAQSKGLIPILCVGETLAEREANQTLTVIQRQLSAVIDVAGIEAFGKAVVAYEPVWAIGTGKNATPEQAQEVHAFIRQAMTERDARIAAGVRILYGGSVKGSNARELFAQPDVDGGLVGGASLKSDEFLKICEAARDLH